MCQALWLAVARGLLKGERSLKGLGLEALGELGTEAAEGLGPGGGCWPWPQEWWEAAGPLRDRCEPLQLTWSIPLSIRSAHSRIVLRLPGFGLCQGWGSLCHQSHSFLPTRTQGQSWGLCGPGPWPSLPARPGARGRTPGHLHLRVYRGLLSHFNAQGQFYPVSCLMSASSPWPPTYWASLLAQWPAMQGMQV